MTETIEAIYQNGGFKLLKPLPFALNEGQQVKLVVEAEEISANPIMKLAENFYEGLSEEDVDEIEAIALNRSNFFGGRVP